MFWFGTVSWNVISSIPEQAGFELTETEKEKLKQQWTDKKRYCYTTGSRKEAGGRTQRFLKILNKRDPKTYFLFARQVYFTEFLAHTGVLTTRKVIAKHMNPLTGAQWAVFETFERNARIGFIEHADEMKALTRRDGERCGHELYALHRLPVDKMPWQLRIIMKRFPGSYDEMRKRLDEKLQKKVYMEGDLHRYESHASRLAQRLGVDAFEDTAKQLLEHWRATIEAPEHKGIFFVHGDMAPNNLYVHDNGDIEFLDFEWVGITYNRIKALVTDFGNLHGRAWNNPTYQEALCDELMRCFAHDGMTEAGKAVVSLGILFSHVGLSGAFENYAPDKRDIPLQRERREATEQLLRKAWDIAGLSV
ncbi:phosphotransferase [Candidatus Kaiserbacteria bacterium]|nr:phosphotransferase [Candidatus Kaiserbacteria bacterium]